MFRYDVVWSEWYGEVGEGGVSHRGLQRAEED
jgi:hypothetical protein